MLLLLWLCSDAQLQQGFSANGAPEPPSLTRTTLNVFDQDKDGSVTLKEAQATLDALGAFASMGAEPGKGQNEMEKMLKQAKKWMPQLFKLLDADSSGALQELEVEWVEKGLEAAKTNVFRNLTRDIFEMLDSDADHSLSLVEVEAAMEPEMLQQLVTIIQDTFPLPGLTAVNGKETPAFVRENLKDIVAALDGNNDGAIERKEAGAAVGAFKRTYIKAAETLKTMGPMLGMFGGDMPMGAGRGGPRGSGGRGSRGTVRHER